MFIGTTDGNFEPWRWWGTDQRSALLKRRKASPRVAHLSLETTDLAQHVFKSLKETSRRHYAQRRQSGEPLGALGPSARGQKTADVVFARWLHNTSFYAVQLFDVYGHELADCVVHPVGASASDTRWQVRVRYLHSESVTEAQSAGLLDGALRDALAAGVKYGEGLPVQQRLSNLSATAAEALMFGMSNLTLTRKEAEANAEGVMRIFEQRTEGTGAITDADASAETMIRSG